jgi:hypothetical protein
MKKQLLSLVFFVIGFTITQHTQGQVQVDSTVNVSTNVNSSNDPMKDALYETGRSILEKTAVGAENTLTTGYAVIVAQQRVKAVTYLVPLLVGIVLLFLGVWFYGKSKAENNRLLPAVLFMILGLGLTVFGSWHFEDIMVGLINPDYAAIQDIVRFGKDFTLNK